MTLVTSFRLTLASLALLSSFATAQTRFCLGGNVQTMSPAEQAGCRSQLQALRQSADALPHGEDWHVVLVCGEQAWQEYQSFTGSSDARLTSAKYDVHADQREIFLRSSQMSQGNAIATVSLLRQIAATDKKAPGSAVGE